MDIRRSRIKMITTSEGSGDSLKGVTVRARAYMARSIKLHQSHEDIKQTETSRLQLQAHAIEMQQITIDVLISTKDAAAIVLHMSRPS